MVAQKGRVCGYGRVCGDERSVTSPSGRSVVSECSGMEYRQAATAYEQAGGRFP